MSSSTDATKKVGGKKIIKKIVKVPALPWSAAPLNTSYDLTSLNKQYWAGKPFPHIALQNFVTDKKFLISIRNELAKLELVEKATDLYSVQQSPDLANIDPASVVAKKHLPCTMMLREALYSQNFRDMVSAIAGCGPLNAKPDMAASAYTHKSHLLVHDDVISTRKIAYIIYLTQEEVNWCAADGGALELYPKSKETPEVPDCIPETRILPLFNQMAFFTVVSGESFHAVQEVYTSEKARLSIQGWFHADATFSEAEKQMSLKAMKKEVQKYAEPMAPVAIAAPRSSSNAEEATYALSAEDKRYLALRGINPVYLANPAIIAQLSADFAANKAISLQGLFVEELQEAMKALVLGVDSADKCGTFFSEGEPPADTAGLDEEGAWKLTGPPHIQRFLKLALDPKEEEAYDAKIKAKREAKKKVKEAVAVGGKRPRDEEDKKGGGDDEDDEVTDDDEDEKKKAVTKKGGEEEEDEDENPHAALALNLKRLIRQVFRSEAFARLVSTIVAPATKGLGFKARSIAARRFRPGLDYTVATVPSEEPLLKAVFTACFTEQDLADPDASDENNDEDSGDDDNESVWHTCDCGGFDGIITAHTDANPEVLQLHDANKAKADHHQHTEEDVVNLPCVANSLSIFLCNTNQMHFTKYVDSAAPSSRVDVTTTFLFDGPLPEGFECAASDEEDDENGAEAAGDNHQTSDYDDDDGILDEDLVSTDEDKEEA